jgi:hypothetical protein
MYSEKEIYDAIKLLKDFCNENKNGCSNCMLRNESNTCGILYDNNDDCREALTDVLLKNYEKPRLILG